MKIGVDRMLFGVLLLLLGIWNYGLDTHIDCSRYDSTSAKQCNDFQNSYYDTIKTIPIGIGGTFICLSFINVSDDKSNNGIRYFQNVKVQVCPNCKEELNGRAWCGNKQCIEFWREKPVV